MVVFVLLTMSTDHFLRVFKKSIQSLICLLSQHKKSSATSRTNLNPPRFPLFTNQPSFKTQFFFLKFQKQFYTRGSSPHMSWEPSGERHNISPPRPESYWGSWSLSVTPPVGSAVSVPGTPHYQTNFLFSLLLLLLPFLFFFLSVFIFFHFFLSAFIVFHLFLSFFLYVSCCSACWCFFFSFSFCFVWWR